MQRAEGTCNAKKGPGIAEPQLGYCIRTPGFFTTRKRENAMRRCYLVAYDICEPKRLRKVHKLMKGYGEAWQYSIFFCVLKDIDRVRMQSDIKDLVNQDADQVLIIDLGPDEAIARSAATVIGVSLSQQESGVMVI
jgi:CRISPR-associated protein Cas2